MFSLDLRTYNQLKKFYKAAPRQFLYATKGMLTTFAFKAREEQIQEIRKSMTVRNDRFIQAKIRYQKAMGSNIDNIHSISGSIRGPRFSGWEEQQKGKTTQRTRTQSLMARSGAWNKQIKGTARMKSSNRFFNPESEMEGGNINQKYAAALAAMRRGAIQKRNFLIRKRLGGRMKTLKRGLWMMRRRLLFRLQTFNPNKVQPKRNPWHTRAIGRMRSKVNLRIEWSKQISRVLKFQN